MRAASGFPELRPKTEQGAEADALRQIRRDGAASTRDPKTVSSFTRRRDLTAVVVMAQRKRLEELRDSDRIGPTRYRELQEDLDWKQLSVSPDEDRRIDES